MYALRATMRNSPIVLPTIAAGPSPSLPIQELLGATNNEPLRPLS
jgi:hypothetical protein